MHKLVELMTIGALGLSLVWSGPGLGEERAGDEFRDTALEYDHQADVAIEQAARSDKHEAGLYLQLAMIHRGMADIKRRAAELADEDRWDEIDWHEYHELEEHREQLVAELTGSASHEMQPDDTGHDFLVAAGEYEAEAANARAGGCDQWRRAGCFRGAFRDLRGDGRDKISGGRSGTRQPALRLDRVRRAVGETR